MRVALVALLALAACAPKLVWHGKSPDRTRDVRVIERRGQYLVLDGVRGPTFDGIAIGALAFSPDSRRLAYGAKREGQWRVVVDSREGAAFDGVGNLAFSADSAHLAYAAQRGQQWHVVVDGIVGPAFDAIAAGSFVFGGSGGRSAYVGVRGSGYHAVVDGVVGPRFDGIGALAFSTDGAHVGYLGRTGDTARAVIDGVASAPYLGIDELAPAPTGGRAAWIAHVRDGWRAVIDGAEQPLHDLVRGIAFSRDGAHVAYVARRKPGDVIVVVDGVEGTSYTGIRPASLVFPPGAARPTYVAQRDFAFRVVEGDTEGPLFDDIVVPPTFSADGAHRGYVGRLGARDIAVLNGREHPAEPAIRELVLAPRGGHHAYLAQRGPRAFVIVDGIEHGFDIVLDRTLAFDASGGHWGCVVGVRAEQRFHVVVDGASTRRLDIEEAIDVATHTQAAGGDLRDNERVLRSWVTAEIARVAR